MVTIGDIAPSVTGRLTYQDQINSEFQLKEAFNEGMTVLYFFPAAFTGVCTKSSCELRDDLTEFKELGTSIYGISADMPFSHKIFAEKNNINYPLISDWNREIIDAYGVRDDNFGGLKGVPKRSLFLISDGKITFKWIAEHPGRYPPFDDLKQQLYIENSTKSQV